MSSRARAWLLLTLGCSAESVGPRAQTLLYIDTDAPLVGQLAEHADPAWPIAIDTLRIDRLDATGEPEETRELVVPDARDWPISLGVVAEEPVLFRLRAFRADSASASDAGPLEPIRNLAIDRLIQVAAGATFERRLVLLNADCFNAPADFSGSWSSCLDAEHLDAHPTSGLELSAAAPATRAGTTPWLETAACDGEPPRGALCIPGGAGLLGDEDAALFALAIAEYPAPSRAMYVSPFFLDETELSVGRYRALLAAGQQVPEPPATQAAGRAREGCTYLGPDDATNDDLPLNCVSYQTARAVCQLAGGELPTEAQWEFAARGRGLARLFPWGPAFPECCTASIERPALHGVTTRCEGFGIEPVGSHADGSACAEVDASRDGVLDLAGSLSEWALDSFRAYDHACWATRGLLRDPYCQDDGASAHSRRGSYFNASFPTAVVVMRNQGAPGDTLGFRCAYPAGGQP